MKDFWKRAGFFAILNAILIGLLAVITKLPADACILYGSLCSIIWGLPHEFFMAEKEGRHPDISAGWGAAILGCLALACVIFALCLISGTIV